MGVLKRARGASRSERLIAVPFYRPLVSLFISFLLTAIDSSLEERRYLFFHGSPARDDLDEALPDEIFQRVSPINSQRKGATALPEHSRDIGISLER